MRIGSIVVVALLSAGMPSRAAERCGGAPGDAVALQAARAAVEAACSCSTATSHAAYTRCAKSVTAGLVESNQLTPACAADAARCAARSTCGRGDVVTCCRTDRRLVSHCSLKPSASACRPLPGGTACTGVFSSCCDACAAGGCATTTTTTTTSTTTTTTLARVACSGSSGPPTCSGECPSGSTCGNDLDLSRGLNSSCACFPSDLTPCGSSAYPTCGGACLDGNVCQSFHVAFQGQTDQASFCACVPATSTCATPHGGLCSVGRCAPGIPCSSFSYPDTGVEICNCGDPLNFPN